MLITFARCYGLGATSENRLKIAFCNGVGEIRSNVRVQEDVPYQSFLHG